MQKLIYILLLLTSLCYSQSAVFSIPLGNDKYLHVDETAAHIDGSIILTCVASQIAYNVTDHKGKAILIGSLISLGASIGGKEFVYDHLLGKGVPSGLDCFKNAFGTLCGAMIMTCKFDFDDTGLVKRKPAPAPLLLLLKLTGLRRLQMQIQI